MVDLMITPVVLWKCVDAVGLAILPYRVARDFAQSVMFVCLAFSHGIRNFVRFSGPRMDPTWRCRPAVTSTSPGPLDRTSGSRTTGEQSKTQPMSAKPSG